MRVTQGTFSFLPDFTDAEIRAQIEYSLAQGCAIGIEYTDDPHPRNYYWEMWGNPMFDLRDAAGAMAELAACRKAHGRTYIRVNAFDSTRGFESFNLGNGEGASVLQVIAAARAVTGVDLVHRVAHRRHGDPPVLVGSSAKASAVLGYRPAIPRLEDIVASAWHARQRRLDRGLKSG